MAFITEVETIFIQRFYSGWMTLRNQLATPIRVMGRRVIELYDALITGNDWEVTPKLSLKRRAGHTSYSTISSPASNLYSWKSNTQGTIPIIDESSFVEFIGPSGLGSIITKTYRNSGEYTFLGIGDYLYAGNGGATFKWDGPAGAQGETNWGLSISSFGNVSGPTLATAGSNTNNGGVVWVNPSNVGSAVSYATVTFSSGTGDFSQALASSQYGFALASTEQILGIVVTFDAFVNVGGTNAKLSVNLGQGIGKPPITLTTSSTSYTLGTSSDLWGSSWNASTINLATFGPRFNATINGGSSATVSVRNVKVTIYGIGGPSVAVTGVGSFSAQNGFVYVVAYGNSLSGEISNASPLSSGTGPFSNASYVGVTLVASSDPQVDQIHVYRTTDSNGGNQFFELPNSPFANANATIQDTAADTSLQVTSQAEINLGNTPPPTQLTNLEYFAGRMWGSVNNVLMASTGPETISGTAPNSNWNPLFQWVIPQPIIRNVRWTNGMIVFTVDDSYIVRGTDISNYTVNEFVKDFGIRSYNAVDTDGTNLYVFTSDRQFILVSASGAQDIGLAIADQLLNVDPSQCYVKVNRYGLDSIVRILDTVNNVYYDFNLNQQCWNLPGILQMPSCTAMGSIETSPGVWRLLLCSTSSGTSTLAYRDINNFLDLGTGYKPNAVFGSIQLADPGALAKFGGRGGFTLEYTNAGSAPTLLVLPNDIGADLTQPVGSQIVGKFVSLTVGGNPVPDPPTLGAQPVNYRSLRYYWSVGKNLSAYVRHLQFELSAPNENKATELIGFCIFGDEKSETGQPGQLPQLQGK